MDDCCQIEDPSRETGRPAGVLWTVLAINAVMFGVEFGAGLVAGSTALMADSLDMLGDAGVYALSLYALHRSARWRAGAAFAKGLLMAGFGLAVLGHLTLKLAAGGLPAAPLMGAFGALALAANLTCAVLLLRFRAAELNLRSTWLCSRNDVVANLGVLAAAGLVAVTASPWPDVVVGLLIATLFLRSAVGVLREALPQVAGRGAAA